jgi:uracil-DNA glycosylase family 4
LDPQSELLRRAYLDAMGIDLFVPRADAGHVEAEQPVAADAGEAGEDALDFDALRQQVASCTRCALHATRTQAVFGVGAPDADWMVIGEAPGAEEDRRGEPFVGRAGKLRAIGQSRRSVFIANILKCRPPGNRDPSKEEALECRRYLDAQIEHVGPRLILAVGRIAAHELLDSDAPVGRLRGKAHEYRGIPLVVTYHPAYLLRSPSQKAKAWDDLRLALRRFQEAGA